MTDIAIPVLDAQLQRHLRVAAADGRDVERLGPFLATFDRTSDHPFLNYAMPDDAADPSPAEVGALAAAYAARGRRGRVEYLPAVAPALEEALVAGGFTVEGRYPVMICEPRSVVAIPDPPGVTLAAPASDAELHAMAVAQHAAFDEPAPKPDREGEQRDRLAELTGAGRLAILARLDGAVVGGGVTTTPHDGVTEIAGIGVVDHARRRGIAGAITSRLARDAFARGITLAFLTPGDAGAHRVYERAGFSARTEMLHASVPAAR